MTAVAGDLQPHSKPLESIRPIDKHPAKVEQDINIQKVTQRICDLALKIRTKVQSYWELEEGENVILMTGPMAAGKSTVLARVSNALRNPGYPNATVHVFGLNDGRDPDSVFNRNGVKTESSLIKRPIQSIDLISEAIKEERFGRGAIIFVSEAQFLADNVNQIDELMEIARLKGIVLIFDCLEKFYNGINIPNTSHIRSKASHVEQMFACDNFSDGKAYNTLRFVRIKFDGTFADTNTNEDGTPRNDGARYLESMPLETRQTIVKKILADPNLAAFVRDGHVLIASHASEDNPVVLGGNELYASGNIQSTCEMFSGIPELAEIVDSYERVKQSAQEG